MLTTFAGKPQFLLLWLQWFWNTLVSTASQRLDWWVSKPPASFGHIHIYSGCCLQYLHQMNTEFIKDYIFHCIVSTLHRVLASPILVLESFPVRPNLVLESFPVWLNLSPSWVPAREVGVWMGALMIVTFLHCVFSSAVSSICSHLSWVWQIQKQIQIPTDGEKSRLVSAGCQYGKWVGVWTRRRWCFNNCLRRSSIALLAKVLVVIWTDILSL